MKKYPRLKLFSGNSHPELVSAICDEIGKLGVDFSQASVRVKQFSDGEINIRGMENVRGMDVYILQTGCGLASGSKNSVNDNLFELFLMLDAVKRASAANITAVLPYYPYARQDKKVEPRVPISAKALADLLYVAGAKKILTMDLHAIQIQGFFNGPVDHLFAKSVMIPYLMSFFNEAELGELLFLSPDVGGAERARAYAKKFNAQIALIDKRREAPNKAEAMNLIGDVSGKIVVILDDMIDTAGTVLEAVKKAKENGAKSVYICATHGIFSGEAIERIGRCSDLESVIVTDTLPLSDKAKSCSKIKVASIAGLFAQAIVNLHLNKSLTVLF